MDIEEILKDYLKDIISVVEIMKTEGFRRNSEQSWQEALYKTGTIDEHDLEYNFHGMGCWVKWKDRIIDFDFRGDVENTIFGIDPWFAACYLQSLRLSGFDDVDFCQEQISKVIEKLADKGRLAKRNNVYFYSADYKKLRELDDEPS
ncbi:DUF6896 domain-containing protein [Parachryseolinea silvisoli]|uniref:DUF6896 domain-containing protein n=1 Tax=Parachryseolinea silvisoli TaxID=2873601 RepID=UPI002265CFA6|nr:hypothetical protein [Parachryseolinea silvisoli]MCD9014398.1 hypothetical protein [Parachryseolinea silvisoli]